MDVLGDVEPIYETLPGWRQDISAARRFEDLPTNAQTYVNRLQDLIGAPIRIVSVGQERSAIILR
jgi:adenylosuccinate synthase